MRDAPPPGCRWEWVPDTGPLRWRLVTRAEDDRYDRGEISGCRYGVPGADGRQCRRRPVAALNRSTRAGHPQWWRYCRRHLFGRRIRRGVVEHRIAVEETTMTDTRMTTRQSAVEAGSWAETLEHGRLGGDVSEAVVRALEEAGFTIGRPPETGSVILFKPTGKYYTEETWRVPDGATTPADMIRSPDFRRISGTGAVLVVTQEPWGYPHLFPSLFLADHR